VNVNSSDLDCLNLITLTEASERYGLSTSYLAQIARSGRLKARKFGKTWVTTPAAVEAYLTTRQKSGFYRDDIEVDNT
jgi:excisionase family DNA binding protein